MALRSPPLRTPIAPDSVSEDEGGEIDYDKSGMNEKEIEELLGDSYDPDADDKF